MNKKLLLSISVLCLSVLCFCQETHRLMFYNALWYPKSDEVRDNDYINIINHIEPDIIVLNEIKNENGGEQFYEEVIDKLDDHNFKSAPHYEQNESDVMLFYNSEKIQLLWSGSVWADPRDINYYFLEDRASKTGFHVYSCHLKASQGDENERRREDQIKDFLYHLEHNGNDNQNVFFCGDFNFYDADEPGFELLLNNEVLRFQDPINEIGNWHSNVEFARAHTQAPQINKGGMDDRFDFILTSSDIQSGANGIKYVNESYTVVGNDGNIFDGAVIDLSNNAAPREILESLNRASDHLPIFLDFCIGCD